MRSSFVSRRKPRRVGQDDGDEGSRDIQVQESPNDEQGKSTSVTLLNAVLICTAKDG